MMRRAPVPPACLALLPVVKNDPMASEIVVEAMQDSYTTSRAENREEWSGCAPAALMHCRWSVPCQGGLGEHLIPRQIGPACRSS